MDRRRVTTSLHAGVLVTLLGVIAWSSGQPFVFPSLGPSAFILASEGRGPETQPSRVVGSHLVGGVAGLVAFSLLSPNVSLTGTLPAMSLAGFRLVASAVLAIVLTSWGMIATDTVHAPACATTLIVSLGLLSTPIKVGIIVVSVVILVAGHAGIRRLTDRVSPSTVPAVSDRKSH